MQDLSLSLLSRGCGRFISSNGNTGRHDGRLDVCFTPQDYYLWRSQDSLLRLSDSGRLDAESTLPKTYSTRRGALLLYSQDLVTMETSCHSETRERKQRVVRRDTRQVEPQLSTLKELTAAILSYCNSQFTSSPSSRLAPPFFPPLHHPTPPPPPIRATRQQPSPALPAQLNPQRLPAERRTQQQEHEDKEADQGIRLDLFLHIPCTSRTPTPQAEPPPWVHHAGRTPEEPDETQTDVDTRLHHTDGSQHADTNHHRAGQELHHPNMTCACDDPSFSIQDRERSSSGLRRGKTGLLPPLPVGCSAGHEPCWEETERLTWGGPGTDEDHTLRLPPIAGSRALTPRRATQPHTQQDARPKAERTGLQSQDNVQRLHQQRLFVPLLFPGKDGEMCGKQSRGGEKSETQYFKKETVRGGGGGGGRLPSEKGSMILLEPGGEPPPPAGALGCVAGRKGPGRQSSLAFLQNRLPDLQDPCESSQSDANRGVVRGVLPLELRDLQNKPVGSLLLGPDGEIVQLSLYENHQDSALTDGDTQDEALQVLSTQGQKLPWIIVLQPEPAHTDGEELLPDVPVGDSQLRQSSHKLLDLPRPTETNTPSPSSHTDPVDVTKENTKRAEAETWRRPKMGAKSVRMPPLRERVGREEPGGGNTGPEEEDEEEEEELGHTGENLQVKEDESISQQSINPNEEQTEGTVDPSRTRTKRRDTEGAAESSGDMTSVKSAESDGQKALGMKKEGRQQKQKTVSDAQSKRSQKQAVRSSRGAAETLEQSALPAVKKRMTDRGGERGEGSRQRKKSAGRRTRRTRGRQQHKELAVEPEEPLEEEEVDVIQETEEEAYRKSTESSSATLRHTKKTNPPPEADADRRPTSADVHSSGSLGSTGAASQPNQRSSRRSVASSCEGAAPASAAGLSSSRGRLSSCSAVMVPEEQLMLNPVKPEASRSRQNEDEEAAALRLAQRAERRRQEVERKRREREEEERKQREREQTEDRMKSELDEERRRRAEEHRLKRLAEEEERRRRDEEEQERARREEAQRERERRRQEERRRQMERFQRMREEEEQRRRAELELLRREEERRREEETRRIQEMDEGERVEYLGRKQQEEEERRNKEEERVRREEEEALRAAEEGRLQAASLARQAALLQQHLAFKRGLVLEAGGLEKTQGISRPWIYSYFTLLQLLGLNPAEAETKTPDL